ncbi:MAG TPA: C40 family peptidase [Pseudonocardia sp.]|nr:C40 family peptidase [Pseudonocardia sp.]
MHRAKHRAAGRASADVLAATLIERFAVDARSRSTRHVTAALPQRGGVAVLDDEPAEGGDLRDPGLFGVDLFGTAALTGSFLAVADDMEHTARAAAPLFRDDTHDDQSPFGAARHAACRRPAQSVPEVKHPVKHNKLRAQPVGAALTVTVLGAAAAVTAVVSPPPAVESTGELLPVQKAAPPPAPEVLAAPEVAAQVPELPTMQVSQLVSGVTAEMEKITPATEKPYTTVATTAPMASAAAMRKAAMTNALAKLGKPYRWGAVGPNAFDCSGLVKWSFGQAGRSLPRTSRAQAGAGTPVSRANLQPGDLVFFYKPISHVGIYIGNNKIVHASRSGQPVKISDMSRMKFNRAVRI